MDDIQHTGHGNADGHSQDDPGPDSAEGVQYFAPVFYGIGDASRFSADLSGLIKYGSSAYFVADSMISLSKSLGFTNDRAFIESFSKNSSNPVQSATIWRHHVLVWAARRMHSLAGEAVLCGRDAARTARILCDSVDLAAAGKALYVYDRFEDGEATSLPGDAREAFESVRAHFADSDDVHVFNSTNTHSISQTAPQRIAFLHLQIDSAADEQGVLEAMFDRVVPSGMIVLEDYGWVHHQTKSAAHRSYFAARNHRILELPTGQGLIIR